jgi:hypothetical protein
MKFTRKLSLLTRSLVWLPAVALLISLQSLGSAASDPKHPASPPASPVDNFPPIGVESFQYSQAALQDVMGTGARYVRIEISWDQVEPLNTTPPNYNWFRYDPIFANLSATGAAPIVTIVDCPPWACPRDIGPLNTNMYGEAAQFFGAMAAHYGSYPYNAHYWELWNEPDGSAGPTPGDHSWGWGAYPDRYAQMLQHVYPAIKAVDSQSVVVTGGVAYGNFWSQGGPFNPDFLPEMIADGGLPYLDAIGFHYYSADTTYANVAVKAAAIRSAIGAPAQNVPFICTEAGLTSDPQFGSSEAMQARYIVKLATWAAAGNVKSVTWFLYQDYASPDPQHDIFAKSGITRVDSSHKPSYTALQTYTGQVDAAAFLGELGPADGLPAELEGYKFRTAPGNDPNRNTWVVWSRSDATATLTIPAGQAPHVMSATSLQGSVLAVTPGSGGTLQVSVGADPVYVSINYNPLRFSDVPYLYWAYNYVDYLASNNIVGGYSDGTFRPGNSATRGQFAKMDTLGMHWTLLNPITPTFADIPFGSTFYQYIETAYSHGIISGYACGSAGEPCDPQNRPYFRQNVNVTRAQIAKIIVGSKGWTLLNPGQPTFTDIPFGSTFYQYIETAVAKGIIAGYACGGPNEPCDNLHRPYFRPGNNATRAQLSKMLALALQQQ